MIFKTGMDIEQVSEFLYNYTSGYPYLVSRLCQLVDERVSGSELFPTKKEGWSKDGLLTAVKMLLGEKEHTI